MELVHGVLVIVFIFKVGNNSPRLSENRKNTFLISDEGPTNCINDNVSESEKHLAIHSTKSRTKFCLSLHYNANNSYLFKSDLIQRSFLMILFVSEVYLKILQILK